MTTARLIFQNYNEVVKQIDILEQQLEFASKERENWWIGGRLFHTVPLDNSARRVDRLSERIEQMHDELDRLRKHKELIDKKLSELDGLEYKVAFARYVQGKSLQQIAEELEYSPEHIRRISSRLKDATQVLQTY